MTTKDAIILMVAWTMPVLLPTIMIVVYDYINNKHLKHKKL